MNLSAFSFTNCIFNSSLNCSVINLNFTGFYERSTIDKLPDEKSGSKLYAYFTPVVFLIGVVGNGISLCVFLSKNMRGMSASRYLAALSTADISTLVFYVLTEWLRRGVEQIWTGHRVGFLNTEGVCQILLYLSYISRFMSAWLIVCFTCERFIGVCMPFQRRNMGSPKGTLKIIISLTVIACMLVVYKPLLSEVTTIRNRTVCASRQTHMYVSFVLDSIYALSITLVPFLIITVLNLLIIRRLFLRNRRQKEQLCTEEHHIRLEFTFILLAISFFFIAFNLPFFSVWFRNFLRGTDKHWISVLNITRTIFYMNYCVNFFLYSITGAYFRRELRALFTVRRWNAETSRQHSNNTQYTSVPNKNSWV